MNKLIKKFAVLGHPISHSLSPQIHSLFAKELSITLEYKKFDINQEDFDKHLKNFIKNGFYGLNITLPLKNSAFKICNELSERASLCKSVNTITFLDNKIVGDTTDGIGLVNDLKNKAINLENKNILLIGAGGSANGVLYDLIQTKAKHIFITNRTLSKAFEMKEYWEKFSNNNQVILEVVELNSFSNLNFDLIINATSSFLTNGESPISNNVFNHLNDGGVCYELMYGKETLFMKDASKKTNLVFDGLGMLIEQAAESFYIWHNLKPKIKNVEIFNSTGYESFR